METDLTGGAQTDSEADAVNGAKSEKKAVANSVEMARNNEDMKYLKALIIVSVVLALVILLLVGVIIYLFRIRGNNSLITLFHKDSV